MPFILRVREWPGPFQLLVLEPCCLQGFRGDSQAQPPIPKTLGVYWKCLSLPVWMWHYHGRPQTLRLYCCLLQAGGPGWSFAVGRRGRNTTASHGTTAVMFLPKMIFGNSGKVYIACTFRTAELLKSRTRRWSCREWAAMASVTHEDICFCAHEFSHGTKEDLSVIWVVAGWLLEDLEDWLCSVTRLGVSKPALIVLSLAMLWLFVK